jgi:FKBP-type peptidyl-prolyl cis-trans isomerase
MIKQLLTLALATLTLTPALTAAETATAAPALAKTAVAAPAPTEAEKTKVLETLGWFLGQNLERLYLSDAELEVVFRGLRTSVKGAELTAAQKELISSETLQKHLAAREEANRPRIEARAKERLASWKKENQDYLLKIDKEPGVQKSTKSGLRYKILAPGTGPKPLPSNTVKVLYTGKLIDGTVFDSTANRNNEPVSFPLSGVIPGWTEGLQYIAKGGKILLYVPAEIAYGENGSPNSIPPAATLAFQVELLDIVNTPPPAPAPAPTPAPAAR